MRKKKISARLNFHNHELVESMANVMFGGDFSKALDFILYSFRTNTHYKTLTKLLHYKIQYDRGLRTLVILDGIRQLELIIKISQDSTE